MTGYEARHTQIGMALIGLAATCWSTGGLFIRIISADVMTMLFWRGIFSGTAVMLLFFALERHRAFSILGHLRWPALIVMLGSTGSMICGTAAIRYTTVADALTIYATLPFVTAGLAWLIIGERPSLRTMVASGMALCGVLVMLGGSRFDSGMIGKLLACGMTLGMAVMTVVIRMHRDIPMIPAVACSAWMCSLFTVSFAAPLTISSHDFLLCIAFGIFQNATGLAFYAIGSRRVPAAEATLLAALEVPLTPLWVWLVLDETPPVTTLAGGAIVLTALFGHIALEVRSSRIRPAAMTAPR